MTKKIIFRILIVIVSFILIFIIPILINQCYISNSGYMTMWNAADALNYYGILLGGFISVIALAITISFNRKQILYNENIRSIQNRCEDNEQIVDNALDKINPIEIYGIIADSGCSDISSIKIKMYIKRAEHSINKVKYQMCITSYKQLVDFVDKLSTILDELKKLDEMFDDLLRNLPETNCLTPEVIQRTNEIKDCSSDAYKNIYLPLIQKKREIFDEIYEYSLSEAKKDLYF